MNPKRLLNLAAAFAAMAAAAVVVVVAAAFALYALARTWLTQAGAAAVVAAAFALVMVAIAAMALRKPLPAPPAEDEGSIVDKAIAMAKERPLVALGAAAAAVTVLVRNPAVLSAVVSAFVAGKASAPEK